MGAILRRNFFVILFFIKFSFLLSFVVLLYIVVLYTNFFIKERLKLIGDIKIILMILKITVKVFITKVLKSWENGLYFYL